MTRIQTALALAEKILEIHRTNPLLNDALFEHKCPACGEVDVDIECSEKDLGVPWLEAVDTLELKQAIQDHEDALVRAQLSGIRTAHVSARRRSGAHAT